MALIFKLDENFETLDNAIKLGNRNLSFSAYQTSEYLLRYALNEISDITRFPDEDFSAELNAEKICDYFVQFKLKYGEDWGKQPFRQSGVSEKKLASVETLESALETIERELRPFIHKEDERVTEVQEQVEAIVLRMKLHMHKEVKLLQKLYAKTDFWQLQQIMYMSASKVFIEELFGKKSSRKEEFHKIDEFLNTKNDFYFSEYKKSTDTLRKQIERHLKDLSFKEKLQDFIKQHNCRNIVGECAVIQNKRSLKRAG